MAQIKISGTNMDEVLNHAIEILGKGGIVAYPTETFYGLGVKFDSEDSLKRLYEVKKRQANKAIPLIIGDKRLLTLVTESISRKALILMERFWPGPLTLILPAKDNISRYITAGTKKVAIRMPGESFALLLAKITDFPLTATSANLSGMPPAQDAEAVVRYFGDKIDLLIDGGHTSGGQPSTIVDVTGEEIEILREGAVSRESLQEFLK